MRRNGQLFDEIRIPAQGQKPVRTAHPGFCYRRCGLFHAQTFGNRQPVEFDPAFEQLIQNPDRGCG